MQLTLESSRDLLHTHMQNQNLRRHCYAVGHTLRAFHDYYSGDLGQSAVSKFASVGGLGSLTVDQWEIVGTLHDCDWEITTNEPDKHTVLLLEWLKDYECPQELLQVFQSHNNKHTNLREPKTLLEWTLECCDELTGFIVAVTLVRPEKKLEFVDTSNVLKKFKQKEFARAVDRSQISQCDEKLGVPLEKFIDITLNAMKQHSEDLGL